MPTADFKFLTSASSTGYVNSDMFLDFFKSSVFPDLEKKGYGPLVRKRLFLDLHSTHVTVELMTLLEVNNTAAFFFIPHSSHLAQMLDLETFPVLKKHSRKAFKAWFNWMERTGVKLKVIDMPWVISHAMSQSVAPERIIEGFRKAGVHPLTHR